MRTARTPNTPTETTTVDELLRLDNRIRALTTETQGLFDNYISELIHLEDLRATLADEMVDTHFPRHRMITHLLSLRT